MRKIYLFLVLVCCGLVACEDDKFDPTVDPAIVEMENLIAKQKGKFNDNELLAKLYTSLFSHIEIFNRVDDSWRDTFKDGARPIWGYILYENGTGSIYYGPTPGVDPEDSRYYSTFQYEYDAKSNTLTTIKCNKFEAKVLYFKDDTMILEGHLLGGYYDEYCRFIMKFRDERREELLNSDIPSYEEWRKMEEMKNK